MGYKGITEKKMEATMGLYIEVFGGLRRDSGKKYGNYYFGLRVWGRDHGESNGQEDHMEIGFT